MGNRRCILYIKNMVCPHCKQSVKKILTDMGCIVIAVELGQAVVSTKSLPALSLISTKLRSLEFDLLYTPTSKLVERIKTLLINDMYYQSCQVNLPYLQNYLELATHHNYQYLETQFYSVYQISIKQYWERLRFERAKELLSYNEKTSEEITQELGYLSRRELETEFEQTLGLSVTEFIQSETNFRLSLDKLV